MTDNEKKAFIITDIAKWHEENATMPVSREAADGWMRKTLIRADKFINKYKGNSQEQFAFQLLDVYMHSYEDTYRGRFQQEQ